jgi:inosine-uridine nucleoside N-ribohydrolase
MKTIKRPSNLRLFFVLGAPLLALVLAGTLSLTTAHGASPVRPVPVIFDSDIGDDIDDTWALGLLLRCPEFDVKLVMGDYGRVEYRTKLFAKFLQVANRTDIPVGRGVASGARGEGPQAAWLKDFNLAAYPGRIHQDGVQAMIDLIMAAPEPITLIAVGPVPNLAAALEREPRLAQRARFVGMHGSVRLGYGGSTNIAPEWNVRADPKACQKVFTAPWDMTITPLDTCGLVDLAGGRYARVRDAAHPVAKAIIENYRLWSKDKDPKNAVAESRSSTLFDTVAVYLALSQELCRMERVGLRVDDKGFTLLDPQAKQINAAMAWTSLDGFRDWLVTRLTAPPARSAP